MALAEKGDTKISFEKKTDFICTILNALTLFIQTDRKGKSLQILRRNFEKETMSRCTYTNTIQGLWTSMPTTQKNMYLYKQI